MSFRLRIANVFRGDRLRRELDEELLSHIEEAIEHDRDPSEARRAFGSLLRHREASHDVRVVLWLDSLRSDAIFGWRQLLKRKAVSAAAILSLGLLIGACLAAFRIVDALFLRALPIKAPERLYVLRHRGVNIDGVIRTNDGWMYPIFRQMRAAVGNRGDVIAISYANHADLTYGVDDDIEKAYLEYISGSMFRSFGLSPALGRFFSENEDRKPGMDAVAVLSYDYWTRRFGRDPKVLGRAFRFGNRFYTITGVTDKGFTGIEPGTMADIFVPTMMSPEIERSDVNWFRILVHLKSDANAASVAEKLHAVYRAFWQDHLKTLAGMPQQAVSGILHNQILLEPAGAGVSEMRETYRDPLIVIAVLLLLVLLIACVNVANLTAAQSMVRVREMGLRISIGAGKLRLAQLLAVQSIIIACLSAASGALFAWWAAPFIVGRINPPEDPARLLLTADWRVLLFGIGLIFVLAFVFGLVPVARTIQIKPAAAIKGGEEPRSPSRTVRMLLVLQIAFSVFVLFAAGLFIATLHRLSAQPLGFSADEVFALETVAQQARLPSSWRQLAEHLRTIPGVESVALADWPLMSEAAGGYISVNDGRPSPEPAFFLNVSPGWMNTMRIPFTAGRDFHASDASPKVAIVNKAFARQFFGSSSALGCLFNTVLDDRPIQSKVIGIVRNARYFGLRGPMPPVAYFPFDAIDDKEAPLSRKAGAFIVRTAGVNPRALAQTLRAEVMRAGTGFRVNNIRTQQEIDQLWTLRERLLAMLALFFATVALLLAGIGLYGVLNYSVIRRQREIGIRMAIGAEAKHVARQFAIKVLIVVIAGSVVGIGLGAASARYAQTLLYQVKTMDWRVLTFPMLAILAVAIVAALPPVIRAIRIDPVKYCVQNE